MNIFKKQLSIRSRIILMLTSICGACSILLIYIGYTNGKKAINKEIFNRLTAVRAAKEYQIETYFRDMSNVVEVLGTNDMIKDAMIALTDADMNSQVSNINDEVLVTHYGEFIDKLSSNLSIKKDLDLFVPKSERARFLQEQYIVNNPHPIGEKHLMTEANLDNAYNAVHAKYHDYLTDVILKFGFYDIFLIDLEKGNIVYTSYKEVDFATNLYSGPYRESNLAQLIRDLKSNRDIGRSRIIDFESYRPSYGAPAAFIGITVTSGNRTVGALVLQLPVDEINRIMTGDEQWAGDGLGESGETYLVGEDYKMRSISRFYLQDTLGYTDALLKEGVPHESIDVMYRLGTTILQQEVKTDGVKAALSGTTDTEIIDDYRDVPVLSSYAPIDVLGLNWAILSEIDFAEANLPVEKFQKEIFLALCVIILLITFIAMYLASRFVKPIEMLSTGVKQIAQGSYKQIDFKSTDEFGELASAFNGMIKDITDQKAQIHKQSKENETLLLNFVPREIAVKIKRGQRIIADRYTNLSLITVDIVGFSDLVSESDAQGSIKLLNALVNAFDLAADKYQVEKIRTIGDTYFAACGLFKPRLDHAKKIIEFAVELKHILSSFNMKNDLNLRLHFGVHSGDVTAGVIGNTKFNFDLLGEVVNTTFHLKDNSFDNEIIVSEAVQIQLKDIYHFEKVNVADMKDIKQSVWRYVETVDQVLETKD